jgi:predicted transcriptional regulator
MAPRTTSADAILPMTNNYMQHIVRGEKTYEFRRYLISPSVKRIWFYLNAPLSHVGYICEIDSARTRNPGDEPLPEDGLGNREYNSRHKDCDRYDFAYRIKSIWRIREPITLAVMKETFGIKIAPRGLIYVPPKMVLEVPWEDQERVVLPSNVPDELDEQAEEESESATRLLKPKRKRSPAHPEGHPKRKVRVFLDF